MAVFLRDMQALRRLDRNGTFKKPLMHTYVQELLGIRGERWQNTTQ